MSRPILEALEEALKAAHDEQERIAAYREAIGKLHAAEGVYEDAKHYARVFRDFRKVEQQGAKDWHYLYIACWDVWYDRAALIGLPVSVAYWFDREPSSMRPQHPAHMYASAFKILKDVEIDPHQAYTLVFEDGERESIISYDTVCVRLPRRMRDWKFGK